MESNNQIPASETSTLSPETQQADSFSLDVEALLHECLGKPALLELDQVDKIDQWLIDTRAARRAALALSSKPFDELDAEVLSNRDFAAAAADVFHCAADVESGLQMMLDLVRQSRMRILVSLSGRDDCKEIMATSDQETKAENQVLKSEAAEAAS